MTFTTDLDDLIRFGHGDLKKLRNIRDTIKHDNFITNVNKKYVESLIYTHLRNQSFEESKPRLKSKQSLKSPDSEKRSTIGSLNYKKLVIPTGVVAAIAIIAFAGFSMGPMNQTDSTNSEIVAANTTEKLLLQIDENSYKEADIISITGISKDVNNKLVELSIVNSEGNKIWNEFVHIKDDGKFSTLTIAAGGGWESSGTYTLKAQQKDLENALVFKFTL